MNLHKMYCKMNKLVKRKGTLPFIEQVWYCRNIPMQSTKSSYISRTLEYYHASLNNFIDAKQVFDKCVVLIKTIPSVLYCATTIATPLCETLVMPTLISYINATIHSNAYVVVILLCFVERKSKRRLIPWRFWWNVGRLETRLFHKSIVFSD